MLLQSGFKHKSVVTRLGTMAYYTPAKSYQPFAAASPPPDHRIQADHDPDRPPLVFFHGFGGGSSAYEWSQVYPAFTADYSVIAPDLLGWGRSDHPERRYTVEDYLSTLTEFLEQTCHGAAIVVASSLTAAMVIRMAIARPELFQALILVAPAGLSDFGSDFRQSWLAQIVSIPVLDRVIYGGAIATPAGIQNFLEQRQFARPDRISPEIVNAYLASAQQPNAEYAALSFVRGDLCFDLATYIGQLTIPTAILWGKAAQLTSVELGQRLAQLNPQAIRGFEVLDDVGLTPQLEVPATTIGLIRQWIPQLTQPTPAL